MPISVPPHPQRKRPAASIEKTTHLPTKRVKGVEESVFVDIVLKRHPQETTVDRLKREHISTPQDVTVEKLKEFLGQKLGYSPCSDFQVCLRVQCNLNCLFRY